MATIIGSGEIGRERYFHYTWEGLGDGDDGTPIRLSFSADKSVQVSGTFSTGGELTLEGSMDNANWETLSDPQGNALALSSGGVKTILQNPRYIRPRVTGGDASTDLEVLIGMSFQK